jgi:hypothetical protein
LALSSLSDLTEAQAGTGQPAKVTPFAGGTKAGVRKKRRRRLFSNY